MNSTPEETQDLSLYTERRQRRIRITAWVVIVALILVGGPLTQALSEGDPEIAHMGLVFTAIMVLIVIFGSLWIMFHLHGNMMPMAPPPVEAGGV